MRWDSSNVAVYLGRFLFCGVLGTGRFVGFAFNKIYQRSGIGTRERIDDLVKFTTRDRNGAL